MPPITIGKLSEKPGCNIETIRYYERIGLLRKPPRSAGGTGVMGTKTFGNSLSPVVAGIWVLRWTRCETC